MKLVHPSRRGRLSAVEKETLRQRSPAARIPVGQENVAMVRPIAFNRSAGQDHPQDCPEDQ